MLKTVLFQTIQFSISTQFSSILPIDRTPGQSGPGSDGNEDVLHIPESSSITGASPSHCLVSYLGHTLGEGVLPLCRKAVDVFFASPQPSGKVSVRVHLCVDIFSFFFPNVT